MTIRHHHSFKNALLIGGLGVAFSLTGAAYAQDAEPQTPIGLFDEDAPSMEGQEVGVDELGQIDITVKDLEIAKVLQLLSIQSQRNIVTSRNVSGKVSADLYGVSFHEALDAILTPNGYGYEEKGNFIYVYTAQELEERQNAMRKTITKVVRLNYISAADASEFLQPLLSSNGNITATGETDPGFLPSDADGGENSFAHSDTLLVKDYEENVEEIMSILKQLDVRPKQVLVEATILQATLTEANAFGIDFAVFANFDGLADFVNPLGAVNQLINGTNGGGSGGAVQSNVGNTATGDSGVKVGYAGSDAAVFLRRWIPSPTPPSWPSPTSWCSTARKPTSSSVNGWATCRPPSPIPPKLRPSNSSTWVLSSPSAPSSPKKARSVWNFAPRSPTAPPGSKADSSSPMKSRRNW